MHQTKDTTGPLAEEPVTNKKPFPWKTFDDLIVEDEFQIGDYDVRSKMHKLNFSMPEKLKVFTKHPNKAWPYPIIRR